MTATAPVPDVHRTSVLRGTVETLLGTAAAALALVPGHLLVGAAVAFVLPGRTR